MTVPVACERSVERCAYSASPLPEQRIFSLKIKRSHGDVGKHACGDTKAFFDAGNPAVGLLDLPCTRQSHEPYFAGFWCGLVVRRLEQNGHFSMSRTSLRAFDRTGRHQIEIGHLHPLDAGLELGSDGSVACAGFIKAFPTIPSKASDTATVPSSSGYSGNPTGVEPAPEHLIRGFRRVFRSPLRDPPVHRLSTRPTGCRPSLHRKAVPS